MKQLLLTLIIVAVSIICVNGQPIPNEVVYMNSDYGLFFLGDSVTGTYYTPLDYDHVYQFEEGIAIVKKDGKMGGLDLSGKIVIPIEYDEIFKFQNGYAVAEKGGYQFLINKSGKTIGNITKYTYCYAVNDGMAKVFDGSKQGFIDVTGKEIIPPKYDAANSFCEGFALVQVDTTKMYINKLGARVGSDKFQAVSDFSDGLAVVMVGEMYGYINKSGVLAIPAIYSDAESFSNGIASVEKKVGYNTYKGVINKSGKEIIPCEYDRVLLLDNGFVLVDEGGYYDFDSDYEFYEDAMVGEKYGLYNTSGQQITQVMYDQIGAFTGAFAMVLKGQEIKLINKAGKEISGPIENATIVNDLAIIQDNSGKMSIMNNQGVVISSHDFILSYPDSSFVVNDGGIIGADNNIQGGKCGLLSKSGTPLTEVKYDYIGISKEGYHLVSRDKKYGFLNRNGKEIVKLDYAIADDFNNGLALVNDSAYFDENSGWLGGHWGYVNQNGNVVIPLIYDIAGPFSDGLALVEKNNEKFYIDKTGKEVLKLSFDDASGFSHGIAIVLKDDKFGAIDKTGKLVIPLIYDGYIDSIDKWHRFRQGTDVLVIDNTGQIVKKL